MEQDCQAVRIAAAQFNVHEGEKAANLERALHFIRRAAAAQASLVLLPEMFSSGYPLHKPMADLAETMEGETLSCLADAAKEHKLAVTGSFPEWDPRDECTYNTAFFINECGRVLGTYRKIHLFDQEKQFVRAGNGLCQVEYKGLCYGLLICFDLEFPEPSRALAMKGSQVLLVVSANMDPYGPFHRLFARVRAIENHMFVAYCNRTGHSSTYRFCGESCLVNPAGEIISELAQGEGLLVGDLRLAEIAESKAVFNYLEERKVD